MRSLSCLLILLCGIPVANASGGLWCDAGDNAARIEIRSGVTRGMGAPLFDFRATISLSDRKVPSDLRNSRFGRNHVAQYWLDGNDLRLRLYREREAGEHGYVEVAILTRAARGGYRGRYLISVWQSDLTSNNEALTYSGEISCGAE